MKSQLTEKFTQEYISAEERRRTVSTLEKKIKQYESEPGNRDGRGVRYQVRKRVKKTTDHLKNAFRHRENHPDSTIRHAAGKLIKRIHHDTFEELAEAASAFRGKLCQSTRRQNEKRRQEQAQYIPISKSLTLKEVCSLKELMSIGKTLQVCVGYREDALDCMRSVKEGESELWTLLREGQVFGLMEIQVKRKGTKSIEECNTFKNENADLSHDEAMEILRKLHVTDIDHGSFAFVGAYPVFLHRKVRDPLPNPVQVDEEWHFVWRTENELVLASTDRKPRSKDKFFPEELNWSQFSENRNGYRETYGNFLSIERLLKIVLQSREFRDVLEATGPTNLVGENQALQRSRISASK